VLARAPRLPKARAECREPGPETRSAAEPTRPGRPVAVVFSRLVSLGVNEIRDERSLRPAGGGGRGGRVRPGVTSASADPNVRRSRRNRRRRRQQQQRIQGRTRRLGDRAAGRTERRSWAGRRTIFARPAPGGECIASRNFARVAHFIVVALPSPGRGRSRFRVFCHYRRSTRRRPVIRRPPRAMVSVIVVVVVVIVFVLVIFRTSIPSRT